MKLVDLLLENQREQTVNKLKKDFVQIRDKENPIPMDPNKVSEKEFQALVDIDPTQDGSYLKWLFTRYMRLDRSERQRFFNDNHNTAVKDLLGFFEVNKKKPKVVALGGADFSKDINQYKSFEDFEYKMDGVKDKLENSGAPEGESQDSIPPQVRQALIDPIKLIGKTKTGYYVYKIPQICYENEDCYKKYLVLTNCGARVSWCTRNRPSFNDYLRKGPYYLFTKLDNENQYQLNYESNQLKNMKNVNIDDEPELKQDFLQWVLDKEGRVPPKAFNTNLDLSKFKIGNSDGFDIYKIGPLYYLDAKTDNKNNLVYYDSEVGKLKNVEGQEVGAKNALKYPYINLIKYLQENNVVNKETMNPEAYRHWLTIRILGNVNVPAEAPKKITNNINISNTGLKMLPDNLTIVGNLNVSNNPDFKQLPKNLKVTGILDITNTGITNVPPGTAKEVIQ